MSGTNGWTERRRKRAACNARKNRLWEKSTGPRSEEGKNAVRNNAIKHGLRSEEGIELSCLLAAQKKFVREALLRAGVENNDRS